jgi:hypothetical protein
MLGSKPRPRGRSGAWSLPRASERPAEAARHRPRGIAASRRRTPHRGLRSLLRRAAARLAICCRSAPPHKENPLARRDKPPTTFSGRTFLGVWKDSIPPPSVVIGSLDRPVLRTKAGGEKALFGGRRTNPVSRVCSSEGAWMMRSSSITGGRRCRRTSSSATASKSFCCRPSG